MYWDQHNSCAIGIIHVGLVPYHWAIGLRNLHPLGCPTIESVGQPYDCARNQVVHDFLTQTDCEWLFFLDSDVIPPPDAILRLMAHRQPIISGVYHRRSPPHGLPVFVTKTGQHMHYPSNKVLEVELVGAGCLLIHRSVLENFKPQEPGKRWFNWKAHLRDIPGIPQDDCRSEDYSFCVHARKNHGYRILVDTSVQCKHVGHSQMLRNGHITPLDHNPV